MDLLHIISSIGLVFWPFLILLFIIPFFSQNPFYQTIIFWIVALILLGLILFFHRDNLPITRIFIPKPPPPPLTEEEQKRLKQIDVQPLQMTFDDALRITLALMIIGLLYRLFAVWIDVLPTTTVQKVQRIKAEKAKENIQDLLQFLKYQ